MPDWRSGYTRANGAASLELLPEESPPTASARQPQCGARRVAALAVLGLVALVALLAAAELAAERRWRPRSSWVSRPTNLEAEEDELSGSDEVSVQVLDNHFAGTQEETHSRATAEASTGQSPDEEESQYSSSEWEVIHEGSANVRAERDVTSPVLATKLSGSTVVGRMSDAVWLALVNEPGYMAIQWEGTQILKQRSVVYSRVLHGACQDVNKHPIWDADTCQNAGFALGYFDTTIGIYDGELDRPEGCYEYQGQLWVSTNQKHRGRGAVGDRKPLCSSNVYATTTTTTVTATSTTKTITTTLTTTTTTTWGSPSMFCIEVVRSQGYELPLVKAQQKVRASIFSCDEYRVFSDGGETATIGIAPDGQEIKTIVIPAIKKKKMDLDLDNGITTNSWLNTETFLQVWHLAQEKDGRLLRHDWVIKVDPDAVFFPERLRARLRPYTVHDGAGKFVMNCDRYNPVALYGSLEIFSRQAMKTYLENQLNCKNNLPWHGWGEDFYMSHCMDHLGVGRIYDFSLIGDARCHYAACSVTSKAVYHDYKNQTAWFRCWHLSRKAEGLG